MSPEEFDALVFKRFAAGLTPAEGETLRAALRDRPEFRRRFLQESIRVGTIHEVLVERPARRGGFLLGRTRANHLVLLDLPASALGSYRQVRLTGTTGSTFTGDVVAPHLAVL